MNYDVPAKSSGLANGRGGNQSGKGRTCLLVLGSHRAGTSMLTRLLAIAGAKLPQRLMGAGQGNESGHWEPGALVQYHDRLLAEIGSAWHDWRQPDFSKIGPRGRDALERDIGSIIADDFGDASLFVLKDPRISRFADLIIETLEHAGVSVVPVISLRNPLDVIASIEKRGLYLPEDYSAADGALVWLRHMLDADWGSRQLPRAIISYESVMADWRGQLRKIAEAGKVDFPYGPSEISTLVDEFISPNLRRFSSTTTDVIHNPMLRGWISDAYSALRILEQDPTSKNALSQLDEIRHSFNNASPLIFGLVDQIKSSSNERLSRTLAQAEQSKQQRDVETAHAIAELEAAKADLSQRIEALQAENAVAKSTLIARDASLVEVTRQASEASSALRHQEHVANQLRTEGQKLQGNLADLAKSLSEKEAELQARIAADDERAAQLETSLRKSEAEITRLNQQRAKIQSEKKIFEIEVSELTAAREALNQRNSGLATLVSEKDAALQAAVRQNSAFFDELRESKSSNDILNTENERLKARVDSLMLELNESSAALDATGQRVRELGTEVNRRTELYNSVAGQAANIEDIYRSTTSWRISSPLRRVSHLLRGTDPAQRIATTPALLDQIAKDASDQPSLTRVDLVVFTICSRNFMAFARTLHDSLLRFNPGARFYVALCDEPDPIEPFSRETEPFPIITLDELPLPDWREMSHRYNITEFNTAIKPFVIQHLFDNVGATNVVYLDPDIYVVNELVEIKQAFASGAAAILTPHMLEPAENAEMNEKRLLQYGIYNLGFLGVRNTPEVRRIIDWWGRRLKTECIIKRDEGLFVDQKWADHFPAFLSHTVVLRQPGYNVAYWNLSSRTVTWNGGFWEANGQPLRFVHFSGSNLDDHKILSRHSSEHRPETIGHLKALLEQYREAIFANRHNEYRRIPYAFSWYGEAGVNEHTPRPKEQEGAAAPQRNAAASPAVAGSAAPPGAVSTVALVKTAVAMAGSPLDLVSKTAKAFRTGGMASVRGRIAHVRQRALQKSAPLRHAASSAHPPHQPIDRGLGWRKRLLFLEWSVPRPDQDSGSRTAFYFLECLTLIGYDVTFIAGDMIYDDRYSKALEDIGISCVHVGTASSATEYLKSHGSSFDIVVLNRGPVAGPLLDTVSKYCTDAKIIFNTVDLHYVRELRDAEVSCDEHAMLRALATKKMELELTAKADVTIVLSSFEKELLLKEVPGANVSVLPLVFSEIDQAAPPFAARRDIVFIGSFPHRPNVDAVLHFADVVFPLLQARRPDIRWHVVGSAPPPEVLALNNRPGIVVHGFVDDLAPLFRSVRLSVAPLRYGAGIKGKIATCLSFGVPCVATSIAAEGMNIIDGEHVIVADAPDDMVDALISIYDDEARWTRMSNAGQMATVAEYSVPANSLRIAELMGNLDEDGVDIEFLRFGSKREHDLTRTAFPDWFADRSEHELKLLPDKEEPFRIDGYCATCGRPSTFLTSFMYSVGKSEEGKSLPNWREHLACDGCGFTMRIRAAMHIFFSRAYAGQQSKIYMTEQTTPLFKWFSARHARLTGSEYLGNKVPLGDSLKGLRNEDLTRLTFADQSFDAILSFDVLEHVSDDLAAFRECYRCLRPGGVLFFTAPFAFDKAKKVVRAEMMLNGEIKHHLPPEIHGNPVDPEGALCFRYFAWDVLDDLKRAGFKQAEAIHYWSPEFGYLGPFGFAILARK